MTNTKQDYVFCIDSDGCAMDTMTYKHQLFFGPIAADVFSIKDRTRFLQEWDRINLFSRTRGVNRFVGLVMGLEFAGVEQISSLKKWVDSTDSLSNASLEAELAQNPSPDLQKALDWSNQVNQQIKAYEGDVLAFPGVKVGLAQLQKLGKVYIVSSANKEAVEAEWIEQGLMEHIDDLYCQDRGKKEDVLAQLLRNGYQVERLLMIGDSPGDLAAAEQNNLSFYPILVGQEEKSWINLRERVAPAFIAGDYSAVMQESLKENFWNNLNK